MEFATAFCALYAAHHVGDYWVQTDHQAQHKGAEGRPGRAACLNHVATYLATQALFLGVAYYVTGGGRWSSAQFFVALAVSGVTHYLADRREHGVMFRLARLLPGKERFIRLGTPRSDVLLEAWTPCEAHGAGPKLVGCRCTPIVVGDNPSLGTGAWALDQSWHLFWGVFVAALILAV